MHPLKPISELAFFNPYDYFYIMQMKLDMAKIKASLRSENDELLRKGFSLPYLENGKVKFLKSDPKVTPKQLREPA
jgi:hypothetical protein